MQHNMCYQKLHLSQASLTPTQRRIILIPRPEIRPDAVPQLGFVSRQLPDALPVAQDIDAGIEIVVPKDSPSLSVPAQHLRSVEVVDRMIVNVAEVLAEHGSALLPALHGLHIWPAAVACLRSPAAFPSQSK